jgi:hypothetical protein
MGPTVDSVSAKPGAAANPGLLCPDPALPSTAIAAGLLLLHWFAPSAKPDPNCVLSLPSRPSLGTPPELSRLKSFEAGAGENLAPRAAPQSRSR